MVSDTSIPRIATIGMFDGVHLGHRHILSRLCEISREKGLEPLAVTFPDHPLRTIAPDIAPPLLTPDNNVKTAIIAGCGVESCLSIAFGNNIRNLTASEFMAFLKRCYNVREVLIGWDHNFGSDRPGSFAEYRRAGNKAGVDVDLCSQFVLPRVSCRDSSEVVSSSLVRRYIEAGDVAGASRLLGREYSVIGTVVSGDRLGRKLGFPTANLRVNPLQALPKPGVYAVSVRDFLSGSDYFGVANLGKRPTVADCLGDDLRFEVHILDFNKDLYGHDIAVGFITRLRDERKFESLDALKFQLSSDIDTTRRLLT